MAIARTRVVERSIPDIEKEQKLILAREGFDGEEWQALIMTGLYRLMRADLKGGAAEFTAAAPKDPRHKHHRDLLEAVGGFESEFE